MKNILWNLFSILFFVAFSIVLWYTLFDPFLFFHQAIPSEQFEFNPWFSIFLGIILIGILLALKKMLTHLSKKQLTFINIGVWGIFFAFQVLMTHTLDISNRYDPSANKLAAFNLLETGSFPGSNYFKVYPNNVGVSIINYWVLKVSSFFSITNYHTAVSLFLMLLLNGTFICLLIIIRKELGYEYGIIFSLLFLLFLPFYALLFYIYSDQTVLFFLTFTLFSFYMYQTKKQGGWLIATSFSLAISWWVKPNAIMILPAILIYLLVNANWKELLKVTVILLATLILVSFLTTSIEKSYGFEKDADVEYPLTHWISMGLNKDNGGMYLGTDSIETSSKTSYQEKNELNKRKIKERLSSDYLDEPLVFFGEKIKNNWSAGNVGIYSMMNVTNIHNSLYKYFFGNKAGTTTNYLIQSLYSVLIFLIIIGCLPRTKYEKRYWILDIAALSVLGAFLFHTFLWEVSPRYAIIFIPFIIFGSVFGIKRFVDLTDSIKPKPIVGLLIATLLLSLAIYFATTYSSPYTKDALPYEQHSVSQPVSNGHVSLPVNETLTQTIHANYKFNTLIVLAPSTDSNQSYYLTINDSTGQLLSERHVGLTDQTEESYIYFNFEEQELDPGSYTISLLNTSPNAKISIPIAKNFYTKDDVFPNLLIDQKKGNTSQSLRYIAYRKTEEPIVSPIIYWVFFTILMILIVFSCYSLFGKKTLP